MASRREQDPKAVADLIGKLVVGRGWTERMALGRLREAWAEVVGEAIAGRSEPVSLERGVLTVRTESGAWSSELTLLAPRLRTAADGFLGAGSVTDVRVVGGARAGRSARPD